MEKRRLDNLSSLSPPSRKKHKLFPQNDSFLDSLDGSSMLRPLSGKARLSIPPRELRELLNYANPQVHFIRTSDAYTPVSVLTMYNAIQRLYKAVVPENIEQRITDTFPQQFIPFDIVIPDELAIQSQERLWSLASSMISKAGRVFSGNEPSNAWLHLAVEVLDGIFSLDPESSLCTMDVQNSQINSRTLLPTVKGIAVQAQKVDLAIAIHNLKPTVRQAYNTIRAKYPNIKLSQMSDPSVARMTLPICVEVGGLSKSYEEASVQVGMWCCAGLLKFQQLQILQNRKDAGPVPFLGLTVIGMDWKLHLAYQLPNNGPVTILGPFNIGGLQDIRSFLMLKDTIQIMAKWAEEEYWTHFKNIFGVDI